MRGRRRTSTPRISNSGNAGKGLSAGIGAGQGDWRLSLASELELDVLAYVRTDHGFLTAMHDIAPSIGVRHRVAVFNPGSNHDQISRLRLVNTGDEATEVVITGIDGGGNAPRADVRLTIPGGQSRTVTAQELESGGEGIEGALGDGRGKWQLNVRSDRPILAMSLLASPTGHLTNLSTAPGRGADATSTEVFDALVAAPVLESKCVNCHVEGGASGTTRLVFVATSNSNHRELNLEAIKRFVASVEDGAALVLRKIQGIGHGGGEQVAKDSDDFANMTWFLDLLRRERAAVSASADTLFNGVAMASPRKLLRRAALVFAGRTPTPAEYQYVAAGTDGHLREVIRNLMTGPRFHEFVLRAANDRLLTDRFVDEITLENRGHFYHFDNKYYRMRGAAVKNGANREFNEWHNAVQYGVARAPLELIAHVVDNDLPYTEVLTADYVMANKLSGESYTGKGDLDHPADVHDFRPTRITDYLTHQQGYRARFEPNIGLRILSPGEGRMSIPHAGILNTLVFLKRYPTTATNRNRARARWTYYHFLGVDIENAASRTTDPVALADTDNPTMHNANCTVCHTVLDPASGAFQNYGDIGLYRDEPGGLDALDEFYKYPVGEEFEIEAETFEDRQSVSAPVVLDHGTRVYVAFANDYYDADTGVDRNLRVDSLELADAAGDVVYETALVGLENQNCGQAVMATAERRLRSLAAHGLVRDPGRCGHSGPGQLHGDGDRLGRPGRRRDRQARARRNPLPAGRHLVPGHARARLRRGDGARPPQQPAMVRRASRGRPTLLRGHRAILVAGDHGPRRGGTAAGRGRCRLRCRPSRRQRPGVRRSGRWPRASATDSTAAIPTT